MDTNQREFNQTMKTLFQLIPAVVAVVACCAAVSPVNKPAVKNPKRTHVIEIWERGVGVPSGKIDLRITTGFNDQTQEFVFKNVPVE